MMTDIAMTDIDALTAASQWATDHRQVVPDDRMLRTYGAAILRDMADRIDRGPAIPLPPSVISALVRERAADLAALAGTDTGGQP